MDSVHICSVEEEVARWRLPDGSFQEDAVTLVRDLSDGRTSGFMAGLFMLKLTGSPRDHSVQIAELGHATRFGHSQEGKQRARLRVGDYILKINDKWLCREFRDLEAVKAYVRRQPRQIKIVISRRRRGPAPEDQAHGVEDVIAGSITLQAQLFLVTVLGAICHRQADTLEGKWQTAGAGVPLGSRQEVTAESWRLCCLPPVPKAKPLVVQPHGTYAASVSIASWYDRLHWYDTLHVSIRGLFSLATSNESIYGHAATGGEDPSSLFRAASPYYTGRLGNIGLIADGRESVESPSDDRALHRWLTLRTQRAGFSYTTSKKRAPATSMETASIEFDEHVAMPVLPVGGDTLLIELHEGARRGSSRRIATYNLHVTRELMGGEGEDKEHSSLQLLGLLGELVGYMHLRTRYSSESSLGYALAAKRIQAYVRRYVYRKAFANARVRAAERAALRAAAASKIQGSGRRREARKAKEEDRARRRAVVGLQQAWKRHRDLRYTQYARQCEQDLLTLSAPLRVWDEESGGAALSLYKLSDLPRLQRGRVVFDWGSQPSGLRWFWLGHLKPAKGKALVNEALASALQSKQWFTPSEFAAFGVHSLRHDHYIEAGVCTCRQCERLRGFNGTQLQYFTPAAMAGFRFAEGLTLRARAATALVRAWRRRVPRTVRRAAEVARERSARTAARAFKGSAKAAVRVNGAAQRVALTARAVTPSWCACKQSCACMGACGSCTLPGEVCELARASHARVIRYAASEEPRPSSGETSPPLDSIATRAKRSTGLFQACQPTNGAQSIRAPVWYARMWHGLPPRLPSSTQSLSVRSAH